MIRQIKMNQYLANEEDHNKELNANNNINNKKEDNNNNFSNEEE